MQLPLALTTSTTGGLLFFAPGELLRSRGALKMAFVLRKPIIIKIVEEPSVTGEDVSIYLRIV